MTTEQEIVGSTVAPRGRAPRSFPTGRVCTEENCSTLLSRYNRKDTCFRHSPMRFPRTRGRTKV
ncbi:MAG: hypothetical protein BMS9Abin12_1307 [Acidimicrobiia bacterium]|nr:MAG: hypothetical protein BMS9Abin12_1307 [Acidimicrobiia bacterium]